MDRREEHSDAIDSIMGRGTCCLTCCLAMDREPADSLIQDPAVRVGAAALRLVVVVLMAGLASACNEGALASHPARDLGNSVAEALAQVDLVVPRFSGSRQGPACPAERLANGAPSPVCSTAFHPRPSAQAQTLSKAAYQRSHLVSEARRPELLRLKALRHLHWRANSVSRDRAVGLLRQAVEKAPRGARFHNDLAAALLLRAGLDDHPADYLEALAEASVAIRLDPRSSEARTNLAFALESFALSDQAAPYWRALANSPGFSALATAFLNYLADGPDQDWSDPEDPRRKGKAALALWAIRFTAGNIDGAAEQLALARSHALLLSALGDSLLKDTLRAIDEADTWKRHALAEAHASIARAQSFRGISKRRELRKAAAALGKLGDPFQAWAAIDQAVLAYYDRDLLEADLILGEAQQKWARLENPHLAGRLNQLSGLVAMRRGRFSLASSHYAKSAECYRRLHDRGALAYLQLLEATNQETAGSERKAWASRISALHSRHWIRDPIRAHTVVEEAARAVQKQAGYEVLRYFLDEQVESAMEVLQRVDQPDSRLELLAYATLDRVVAGAESGRSSEFESDLSRAEALWARLPGGHELKARLGHDLAVVRAAYFGGEETAFPTALAFFERDSGTAFDLGNVLDLYSLWARFAESRGDLVGAERHLEEAIGKIENQRWELLEARDRARFLSKMGELTESLVAIQLAGGREADALLAVERSENRLLLDEAGLNGSVGQLDLDRLKSSLPERVVLIRYQTTKDDLLLWVIQRNSMFFEMREVGRARLRQLARGFREAIVRGHRLTELRALGEELAELVLPSQFDALPPATSVVIVPSADLLSLPFAALSHSGRYLVELHPTITAPSLSFLAGSATDSGTIAGADTVLIVGDPEIDSARYPNLFNLPFARRGAAKLGRLAGKQSTVLVGKEATRARILSELPKASVFSFSGHATLNPLTGERALVVAPDGEAATLLTSESLLKVGKSMPELVILSACTSGPQTIPETSELAGLPIAFLARGTHVVVATGWEIGDVEAEAFTIELHRQVETIAGSYARAAQGAQLALLDASSLELETPAAWAAYQVIIGSLESLSVTN